MIETGEPVFLNLLSGVFQKLFVDGTLYVSGQLRDESRIEWKLFALMLLMEVIQMSFHLLSLIAIEIDVIAHRPAQPPIHKWIGHAQ